MEEFDTDGLREVDEGLHERASFGPEGGEAGEGQELWHAGVTD